VAGEESSTAIVHYTFGMGDTERVREVCKLIKLEVDKFLFMSMLQKAENEMALKFVVDTVGSTSGAAQFAELYETMPDWCNGEWRAKHRLRNDKTAETQAEERRSAKTAAKTKQQEGGAMDEQVEPLDLGLGGGVGGGSGRSSSGVEDGSGGGGGASGSSGSGGACKRKRLTLTEAENNNPDNNPGECRCIDCKNNSENESERTVVNRVNRTKSASRSTAGCNCKNTKCLKKYCICFAASVGCSTDCQCSNCCNTDLVASAALASAADVNGGRWSDVEHQRFLQAIELFPGKAWKQVSEYVRTRSNVQCQTHAQNWRHATGEQKRRPRRSRAAGSVRDDDGDGIAGDRTAEVMVSSGSDSSTVVASAALASAAQLDDLEFKRKRNRAYAQKSRMKKRKALDAAKESAKQISTFVGGKQSTTQQSTVAEGGSPTAGVNSAHISGFNGGR
jgi:SHAQKYF class myb-like DNA-binding protein